MGAAGTLIACVTAIGLLGSALYFRLSEAIAHGPLADGETGTDSYLPEGLRIDRGELPAAVSADARPTLGNADTGNTHCGDRV